jgi:hypothetical protein
VRIVVNHLTRMQRGYICVAGINPDTGHHVRPIPENDRPRRTQLVRHGGPFDIASVVDLGRASYVGHAPEMEDYRFNPRKARRVGTVAPQEFWELLKRVSRQSLAAIFGDDLMQRGGSCTLDVGMGRASLGCLLPSQRPVLHLTDHGKIRLHLTDGAYTVWLSVTDLRLYGDDQVTPRRHLVGQIAARIARGAGVIVAVGLSRPWQKLDDTVERHWLQVNNIHLEDNPAWQETCDAPCW